MEKTIVTVIIGADHRGYRMKEELKRTLSEWGYLIDDQGAHAHDPDDDYPDFGFAVGRAVRATGHFGILLCGSGVGIAIAANKVPGIRAALCMSPDQAVAARRDDNANVLVIASDFMTAPVARRIMKAFLETVFHPKERYLRRLQKIEKAEKGRK